MPEFLANGGRMIDDFEEWYEYVECWDCGEEFSQDPDIPVGECPNCGSNNIVIKESI